MYTDSVAQAGLAGISGLVGMLFCCFYFILLAIIFASIVLWVWMLIDVVKRKDSEFGPNATKDTKLIWLLIILLTQGIGAFVYYLMIYRKYPEID